MTDHSREADVVTPPGGGSAHPGSALLAGAGDGTVRTAGLRPAVLAAILGLVMLLAGLSAVFAFGSGVRPGAQAAPEAAPAPAAAAGEAAPSPSGPGLDPELDALWVACAAGDLASCDELFARADAGSEYARFASTCGDTIGVVAGGDCYFYSLNSYGDDPELDALWDACSDGDMEACDNLRYSSPAESDYYALGTGCNGRAEIPNYSTCVSLDQVSVGDDPEMDGFYADCASGDLAACDELSLWAQPGTEYHEFGISCGGTESPADVMASATCVLLHLQTYGSSPWFDAMYDACAAGDLGQCDWLSQGTGPLSEYGTFGLTCGGTRPLQDEWLPEVTMEGLSYDAYEMPPPCDPDGNDAYGDDPMLDRYYDQCVAGNMVGCMRLGHLSPTGSEYQLLSSTCGNTVSQDAWGSAGTFCWVPAGDTRGSDPTLDALWDSCEAGNMNDCDDLAIAANENSDYWLFGATCGNRHSKANAVYCAEIWAE